MKKMKKLKQLEAAFKDNFNADSAIAISSTWQAGLLERLHQLELFKVLPEKISAKFERNIWRLTWITFALSATAAIIFAVYIYVQPKSFDDELNDDIYSNLAMLD